MLHVLIIKRNMKLKISFLSLNCKEPFSRKHSSSKGQENKDYKLSIKK